MKLNIKMSRLNPPKVMCVKLSSYTYLVHTGYSHIVVEVNIFLEYSNKEEEKKIECDCIQFFYKEPF